MKILLSILLSVTFLRAMDTVTNLLAIAIKESEIENISHNEEDEHVVLISYVAHLKNGDVIHADFDPIMGFYNCRKKTTWLDDAGRANYLLQPLSSQYFQWLQLVHRKRTEKQAVAMSR